MAEVIWSDPALVQLEAIVEFIALDKPEASSAVARRVFQTTDRIAELKRLGRPIPEFEHASYRQIWIKPCWIYYRVEKDAVVILHVRRGEQILRIEELLRDES